MSKVSRVHSLLSTPARRVAIATSYAQLVLLGVTPLLTRIYSVESFSEYQVAFSAALVLQLVLSAGVEYIVPATGEHSQRAALIKRGLSTLVVGTTLGLAAVAASFLLTDGRTFSIVLSTVLVSSVLSLTNIDNARLLAGDAVRSLVARNLIAGTVGAALQVGVGLAVPTLFVLVGSIAVGRIASLAIRPTITNEEKPSENVQPARNSKGEGFAWVTSIVLSNAALQFPIVVGGIFYGVTEIAQLAIAIRIVGAVASLVGMGLSMGLTYKIGQMLRSSLPAVGDYVERQQRKLAVVSVIVGLLLTLGGPTLTPFVLGDSYRLAGELVGILGIPFSLQLVNRTMTPVFPVARANNSLLTLQVFRALGVVLAVLVCVGLFKGSVLILGIVLAVFMLVFYVYFFYLSRTVLRIRLNAMSSA